MGLSEIRYLVHGNTVLVHSRKFIESLHFRVHKSFRAQTLPTLQIKHFCTFLWEPPKFGSVIAENLSTPFLNWQGDNEDTKSRVAQLIQPLSLMFAIST